MKIALCQINPILGNFNHNCEKILEFYKNSIELNADLIVFPELAICGYPPQDLIWEDGFFDGNLEVISQIASFSSIPVIIGYIRKDDNHYYNSAAVCYDGKLQYYVDKILLPTYDVFDETRYFNAGNKPKVIPVPYKEKKINVGIQICEDLWDENYSCKVSKVQMEMGAEIILNISASPYHINRFRHRKNIILEKIRDISLPFVYCNMVGAQDELIFDGQSVAFSSNGKLINRGQAFEEEIIIVDFNSKKEIKICQNSEQENIYNALTLGVKDYYTKTGHGDAVIGLSGGIDSALVTSIAVNALGSDRVHAISLPSKYSSDHSLKDAKQLAKNFGIDYRVIPIQESVDALESALHPFFIGTDPNVAEENIQARARGNILMAISNKFGWMVLSTGNKTEMALGYCTLYGDMSGGLSVISDLSKEDVYALSNWININKNQKIPENILKKEPSAELAPNQIDPFEYDIISPLVDDIIEKRKSPKELIESGLNKNLVYDIYNRIMVNEYKRRQSAPGLRLKPKAFGMGRRFPIINQFNLK